jgi:hypothetical protein
MNELIHIAGNVADSTPAMKSGFNCGDGPVVERPCEHSLADL